MDSDSGMSITPIFRYPALAVFKEKAGRIQNINTHLSKNLLVDVLQSLREVLGKDFVNQLVNDLGHGLNHAFFVLELALTLAEGISGLNFDSLACGAFLHDIYAIIDRRHHDWIGSEIAKRIAEDVKNKHGDLYPDAVAYIVRSHNNKEFAGRWKFEAELVRDADTLHEGLDLDRIVWVSCKYNRQFYNPDFHNNSVDYRLDVLCEDDRSKIEAQDCDALMFLLRNVTKSIAPSGFVTEEAKNYIRMKKVLEKNKIRLLKLIRIHVPDSVQQEKAIKLLEDVTERFWRGQEVGKE